MLIGCILLFCSFLSGLDVSGVALVAEGEQVLHHKAYGRSDRELSIPNQQTTLFPIGSITKQFTASAILRLQDEKLLNIAQTLEEFFPEFPNGNEITIHHLLSHQSGFPNFLSRPNGETELADLNYCLRENRMEEVSRLTAFSGQKQPGDFRYCNANYSILAAIVEKVSGKKFSEYLRDTFFIPLSMQNTFVIELEYSSERMAKGYKDNHRAESINVLAAQGSGNIVSTAYDLYLWSKALHQGKILSDKGYSSLISEHSANKKVVYGYGFFIKHPKFPNHQLIGHFGKVNGFLSVVLYDKEKDRHIIILSNSESTPLPEILKKIDSK